MRVFVHEACQIALKNERNPAKACSIQLFNRTSEMSIKVLTIVETFTLWETWRKPLTKCCSFQDTKSREVDSYKQLTDGQFYHRKMGRGCFQLFSFFFSHLLRLFHTLFCPLFFFCFYSLVVLSQQNSFCHAMSVVSWDTVACSPWNMFTVPLFVAYSHEWNNDPWVDGAKEWLFSLVHSH